MWRGESTHVEGVAECVTTPQQGDGTEPAHIGLVMEADAGYADLHGQQEIKQEPADQERDNEEATYPDQDADHSVQSLYSECQVKEEVTTELYPDHEIKEEMVLGPVVLLKTVLTAQDPPELSSTVRSRPQRNGEGEKLAASPAGEMKMYIEEYKRYLTHEQKPFRCNFCVRQFSRKSDLIQHERIHKPFHCKLCEMQFSRKSVLIQHERIHTGVKTFHCKLCEMQFPHKYVLVQHERIHTGVKPFHCKICKRQFYMGSSLSRHKCIHT